MDTAWSCGRIVVKTHRIAEAMGFDRFYGRLICLTSVILLAQVVYSEHILIDLINGPVKRRYL